MVIPSSLADGPVAHLRVQTGAVRIRGGGCAASKDPADGAAEAPRAPQAHAATEAALNTVSFQDLTLDDAQATVLQELRPLDDQLRVLISSANAWASYVADSPAGTDLDLAP